MVLIPSASAVIGHTKPSNSFVSLTSLRTLSYFYGTKRNDFRCHNFRLQEAEDMR